MRLRLKQVCFRFVVNAPVTDISPDEPGAWFRNPDSPGFAAFAFYDVNVGASIFVKAYVFNFEVAGFLAAFPCPLHC